MFWDEESPIMLAQRAVYLPDFDLDYFAARDRIQYPTKFLVKVVRSIIPIRWSAWLP